MERRGRGCGIGECGFIESNMSGYIKTTGGSKIRSDMVYGTGIRKPIKMGGRRRTQATICIGSGFGTVTSEMSTWSNHAIKPVIALRSSVIGPITNLTAETLISRWSGEEARTSRERVRA